MFPVIYCKYEGTMLQDVHHLVIISEYECSKVSCVTSQSVNLPFKSKFV